MQKHYIPPKVVVHTMAGQLLNPLQNSPETLPISEEGTDTYYGKMRIEEETDTSFEAFD